MWPMVQYPNRVDNAVGVIRESVLVVVYQWPILYLIVDRCMNPQQTYLQPTNSPSPITSERRFRSIGTIRLRVFVIPFPPQTGLKAVGIRPVLHSPLLFSLNPVEDGTRYVS